MKMQTLISVLFLWSSFEVLVEGSTNIARGRSTSASSLLSSSSSYRTSNAVDGKSNTFYHSKHDDTNPWWAVDLGTQRNINEVTIKPYHTYLHSFLIGVSDASPPTRLFPYSYKVCHKHKGAVKANTAATYKCQPNSRGRYVIIQIPGRYGYLALFEVAVYAYAQQIANLARGKKVWESSHYQGVNRAAKAVDGSSSYNAHVGQCAHTKMEDNPWWVVDLGTNYVIKKVVVQTRQDCCYSQLRNFVVGVTNQDPVNSPPKPGGYTVCRPHFGAANGKYALSCYTTVQGRYVIVQMPGHDRTLVLCEVEVYTY
eukprot:GHVR01169517.1.p1 GENE.GHVR01169517.1~~GHVR01169517.1.p1  ORF type:complete len:312 (-),score=16.12 GHVR01169517.1:639-1574(-)